MRNHVTIYAALYAALAMGASFLPAPAMGAPDTGTISAGAIETVTVTARRRAEDAQTVPENVTAHSGEALHEDGVTSSLDLQNLEPTLTVTGSLGSRDTDVFSIRGQSQPFGGADPGVQTYFAEVPFDASGPGSYYDLDNVQVLSGPQGTLFGRNTTGGAILFEPKRPTDEFGGYVDGQLGNFSDRKLSGAIDIPIVDDTLMVRAAGAIEQRNGFTKDVTTGSELDNLNYQAFRVGVTWRPISGFENYLLYDYLRDRNHGTGAELTSIASEPQLIAIAENDFGLSPLAAAATVGAFYPSLQFAVANQQALGPRQTTSSIPLFYRRESWGLTDIASYDITSHLRIRNIFGYRSDKEQPAFDYDGSFLPILDIPNSRTWESNSLQVTEEFQLQGESNDNSVQWIAGFYHELDHPGGYAEVERDTFGGGSGGFPFSTSEFEALSNGGTSNAVFGQASWKVTDKLTLTGGGRYTWDRKVADANICVIPLEGPSCPFPVPNTFPYGQATQSGSFHAPSWTLAADYQVTDDSMVYATYRRGYKSGGFNSGAGAATDFAEFQPEYLTDVEIGAKNNWTILGVPGRTNADAYYGWYSNIQKNDLVAITFSGPLPEPSELSALTFNAARAKVQGFDLSSTFIPTDNLEISVFYSYTDATYSKFVLPEAISIDEITGIQSAVGALDHAGDPFAYTPKSKFGLQARYHIPVDSTLGMPYIGVTWSEQSKVWFSDLSDIEPNAFQKGYDLVNLRIDWDSFLGQPFDLSAFVNNATDKTYKVGANALEHLTGTTSSIYGAPRMWGFELRYRFGADAAQ
jgi:iron complex outermembrane recepter protein